MSQLSPVLHSIWPSWSVSPAGRLAWVFRADIIFHADRWWGWWAQWCQLVYGAKGRNWDKKGVRPETQPNSSKLEKILSRTQIDLAGAGGGQGGQSASVNINIPDKYSCPGVQIVVTKWGSWVDVLFMMVMIIMLHKKEISISHYLPPRTTSLYFFPQSPSPSVSSRNISRSDSYSIWKNNF